MSRPTAAEGLAAGAVVAGAVRPGAAAAAGAVILGDAEGDVVGLPMPGLALGLPLVDGALLFEPASEPPVAPAGAPEGAPAGAPDPPDGPPPPPAAPPPPPAAPPPPPAPPPPRASAYIAANGPTASAKASRTENVIVIFVIGILLEVLLTRIRTTTEQRLCHPTVAISRRIFCGPVRGPTRHGIMSRF